MLLRGLGEEIARQRRDVGRRQALEEWPDPRRALGGDEAKLRPMAADRVDELACAGATRRSRWPASIRAACSSAASAASFLPRAT
jgi:hypothetical protein